MGYHVTILRTDEGRRVPISREETEDLVSRMPGLSLVDIGAGRFEIRKHTPKGDMLLVWQDGEVWTSNPSSELLQLMLELGAKLNARVRGDDFKTYETPERTYVHPDDKSEIEGAKELARSLIQKSRRDQWILNAVIIGFFLVLVLLVNYLSR